MGQGEIIELLSKMKVPLSRKEIADLLGDSPDKVTKRLSKLVTYHEVQFIEINRKEAMKRTEHLGKSKVKQRMRLYFIKL